MINCNPAQFKIADFMTLLYLYYYPMCDNMWPHWPFSQDSVKVT